MNPSKKNSILTLCGLIVLALLLALASLWPGMHKEDSSLALQEMKTLPDTLRVVTLSGSTTYFTYKDEPMGYQYDLISLIAKRMDKPMKILVAPHADSMLRLLESGAADLCITPQAVTQSGRKRWRYTGPQMLSGLVLVQRKNTGKSDYVHKVTELAHRTLTITPDDRYEERLQHLSEQIGQPIAIQVAEEGHVTEESLIGDVAAGKIPYTVADYLIAKTVSTYYNNVDISVEIGFRQQLQWVVRPGEKVLADSLDAWAAQIPKQKGYQSIYKRYFELSKGIQEAPIRLTAHGDLSAFDDIFRQEARRLQGWSWQLLASIAYFESNFTSEVVGWSGARGLMGIMPSTGRIYGASANELLNPAVSVRVAVDCLLAIRKSYAHISDADQQLKICLAAYNAGIGHVTDARRLAAKYGFDPDVWDGNVEECIKMKREPQYYNDPVCRAGYLRGTETLKYVNNVFGRMQQYCTKFKK